MRTAHWLSVATLLSGCGDDDARHDALLADPRADAGACLALPCPASSPWNQATCRCELTASSCDFDGEIARRTGAAPIACGSLPLGASIDALKAAQKCVLDAAAAKSSFKLRVTWRGIDSTPGAAFAGNGTTVSILDYDSDPSGGSGRGARLSAKLCDDYQVIAGCEPANGTLCLECKRIYEASAECEPAGPDGSCNRAGNYEVGKEGGYLPCCPGLREVFRQHQATTDDGLTCVDPPLRVWSCIDGRCGDGVCSTGEAIPCGKCTLDCPQLGN